MLLDVGSWHDFGWKMQPFAKVVEALGCQSIVVPLPRELGLDIAPRGKRLTGLDDLERIRLKLCVRW